MRWLLIVAVAAAAWPASAHAARGGTRPAPGEAGSLGLGISVGDPTGATAKLFLAERHALQSSVGFGPIHLGAGRADLTYLFHSKAWGTGNVEPRGYVGLGAGVAFWDERVGHLGPFGPDPDQFERVAFFFRAPVLGMAFRFKKVPVDVFFEAAYSPLVGPAITFWNFDFALGARYWF